MSGPPRRRVPDSLAAAVASLLAGLLGIGLLAPAAAHAEPAAPPEEAPGSSYDADRARAGGDIALAADAGRLVTRRESEPVAPGLEHTSIEWLDARGWIRGDVLVADLDPQRLRVEYLSPGTVSGRAVLSQQAAREGAIAAVNGDFFDINDTGAPLGVGIDPAAGLLHGPETGWNQTVSVGRDGLGRLAQVFLDGRATSETGDDIALSNLNSPTVRPGGVGLFSPAWGAAPRSRTVEGAGPVREVLLRDGAVAAVTTAPGTEPLAEGELALVGVGAGAERLAALTVGERVTVTYRPRSDAADIAAAVGGNKVLVRDGDVLPVDDVAMHPRTAVGFSADGRRMVLVTIDGRQADSRGMTERELGAFVRELGADDVLNLDGGGSSTMLAREAGVAAPAVVNSPSDGGERLTPNGLGLLATPGSGELTGFRVETVVEAPRAERVLAGLTRRLVARGHDETYAPVSAEPRWHVEPAGTARVTPAGDGTAVVTGRRAGTAVAIAGGPGGVDRQTGRLQLDVLGEPVRLTVDAPQVSLPDVSRTGRFSVWGHDRDGFSTWIEPADLTLEYDETLLSIRSDGNGFAVLPKVEDSAAAVTVRVGDLRTTVAVTVGLRAETVDDMDTLDRWRATTFPSVVRASVSSAPGRTGGAAVALDYSLTGTTATRAAYLTAATPLPLPGAPQKLGAWVYGDGKGAWLRANIYDAGGGAAKTLNLAASVNWTGWRYVEADIPAGLLAPYRFFRLYVVETDRARQYSGRLVVDDLTVKMARGVTLPAAPRVLDPVVVTDGTVTESGRWRFAVLSDAQFTADAPQGELVAQARRTLREAVAARPDFVVINGDFVDRAFPQDIALARQVITEEIDGRVPWYYVPGNHEATGPGDLSTWRATFGAAQRTFDHKGTRFVLLDSSLGSLRAGSFAQLVELRRALDEAATDPQVRSVVAMAHHPIDDPAPTKASQLADRKEAALVVDWLSAFRASTGKGAAYIASHAGAFGASRTDGVLQPLIGNSGKGPSAAPDAGGFTGWALVGIDPTAPLADPAVRHRAAPESRVGQDAWLRVEMRPHVDALELAAPSSVAVGKTERVTATVVQDGRRVPVAYPVSADWAGSAGLHIGAVATAPDSALAAYDPGTGEFVGLQDGSVVLSVTVNGVTRTALVAVRATQAAAA